jgi:hypothetical protein
VEDRLVHGDVGFQPLMINPIKARANVAFEYPAGAASLAQNLKTLFQRIRTASFPTEAIGMGIRRGLQDRIQTQQVKSLLRPVGQGGNP